MASSPSDSFLEQFTADQHPSYLTGACTDFIEFCVSQNSPGRVLIDVPRTPEKLNGIKRHLGSALSAVQDGPRGSLSGRLPPVTGLGYGLNIGSTGIQRRVHIRKLGLDQLE